MMALGVCKVLFLRENSVHILSMEKLLHHLECKISYIAQHCGIDEAMKRDQMEVQPTIPP